MVCAGERLVPAEQVALSVVRVKLPSVARAPVLPRRAGPVWGEQTATLEDTREGVKQIVTHGDLTESIDPLDPLACVLDLAQDPDAYIVERVSEPLDGVVSVLDLEDLVSADHAVGADERPLTDTPLNTDRAVVARPEDDLDHHPRKARLPSDPPEHLRARIGSTVERVGLVDGVRAEQIGHRVAQVINDRRVGDGVVDHVSSLRMVRGLRDGDRTHILIGYDLGVRADGLHGLMVVATRWRRGGDGSTE